jgi:hypothetical protein
LFAQDEALDPDVVADDFAPIASVLLEQALEDEAARRVEVALDAHAVLVVAETQRRDRLVAPLRRDQAQRLFVHGAGEVAVGFGLGG